MSATCLAKPRSSETILNLGQEMKSFDGTYTYMSMKVRNINWNERINTHVVWSM